MYRVAECFKCFKSLSPLPLLYGAKSVLIDTPGVKDKSTAHLQYVSPLSSILLLLC